MAEGEATGHGYLDDYAFFAAGLLDVYEATEEKQYLESARDVVRVMLEDFHDADAGGFYFTSGSHDELLLRAKELGGGGNMPAGNGVAASALLRLAVHTGEKRYAELASETLNTFAGTMWSNPHGAESMLAALAEYQIAIDEHGLPPLTQQIETDADVAIRRGPVLVEVYLSHDVVIAGQDVYAAVRLTLDEGVHVYAKATGRDDLLPTEVVVEATNVAALGDVAYPEPEQMHDEVLNEPLPIYRGEAMLLAPLRIVDDLPQGEATIVLDVKFQACDGWACLAPELVRIELPVSVSADTADQEFRHADVFRPLGVEAGG